MNQTSRKPEYMAIIFRGRSRTGIPAPKLPNVKMTPKQAHGEFADMDYAADDMARFEAVVAHRPGFATHGVVRRIVIGDVFQPKHAKRLLKAASEKFEQAADNARKAALVILEKLRSRLADQPDDIEIAFGLKTSGELGSLVVAKAGVEASYSVTLKWKTAETSQRARPRKLHSSHS